MPGLKTLSVLAGIIAALALSATPAFAEFQSTAKPAQSQGNLTITETGEFKDVGAIVTCVPKEIVSQYHIQAKGQIKQQQTHTTKGPHFSIQIKSWGKGCSAEILKEKVGVEIKPCGYEIVQQQGFTATSGIAESCLIKIGPSGAPICELQIPAGMETAKESGQGINVGLKEVALENSGTSLIGKVKLTGGGKGQGAGKTFVVSLPKHPLCPIKTNEEGETTGLKAEAEGVNAA